MRSLTHNQHYKLGAMVALADDRTPLHVEKDACREHTKDAGDTCVEDYSSNVSGSC